MPIHPQKNDSLLLSIIIPAHNEENRLPESLDKINAFLSQQTYTCEIIVVENGSSDDTIGVVERFAAEKPYIKLIVVDTRGKGLAVKSGMLAAQGDFRFICDTDLSMPIEEIAKFLPADRGAGTCLESFDVAIGSREAFGAVRYDEPWHRHFMGRVLNAIIKIFAVRGFEDTQCGFKMFSRAAAEDLFRVQTLSGIGFDIELLFVAKKRGYTILEIPINWYFNPDSRMRLVRDSLTALLEIYKIRRNWRNGVYNKSEAA
ncbi:MAG: glycosyltransferase family 2 protein [Anaerolineales bacterium]|nr:glycosyltransferase family 2 protein [Anaerolineales bacterium]